LGINDEETWPARLQEVLLRDGLDAEVINAGVPGYTAFQGRRFLERHGLELRPDVVVATFGFNDDASWGSNSDPETAHDLSVRWWEPMLGHSRAYLALRRLLRSARPTAATGSQSGGPPSDGAGKGRARLSAEEFRHELLEIKRLCDRHGIGLILMIWPYEAQVSQNLPRLVRHQTVTAAVCQEEQVPCVNLIEAFIGAERSMFLDHVHANPDGSRVAAGAVLSAVRSLGWISSERP
jgi:lysophospholipase L1-like esterase